MINNIVEILFENAEKHPEKLAIIHKQEKVTYKELAQDVKEYAQYFLSKGIKKGDNVQVLSGNDKGKTGEVLEVIPKTEKIVVKGVNIRKKHVKARKQGEESGIISVECSIPAAKVNVVCPKCGKTTKVGYSVEKDEKVRICKKCGAKLK